MSDAAPVASQRALVDFAVAQLEAAIWSGELSAGSRVPEHTLALRFGVSRGALREAARTLEGRRLLERTPHAGVRVINPSLADVEQLLMAREALEGMACRQAAECMTLPETRRLRACLSAYDETIAAEGLGGVFRRGSLHDDFHVAVVRGSHNHWLYEMLCRDLYSILRVLRLRSSSFGKRAKAAEREHHAILDAIEQRDPDSAERLMREHIAHGRANLLERLRPGRAAHGVGARRRAGSLT